MNNFKVLSKKLFCNKNCGSTDLNSFKNKIFTTIGTMKNYNLRDYYNRRFEYDFQNGKYDSYSEQKS